MPAGSVQGSRVAVVHFNHYFLCMNKIMTTPIDPYEFRKKSLDHHFEQYLAFTRLILSLATGSFSLFAALSGNLLSNIQYVSIAKVVLPLLLVSMLSGVLVQYRLLLRPLHDLDKLAALLEIYKDQDNPIIFRKLPSAVEKLFFHIQINSFALAFIALSVALL